MSVVPAADFGRHDRHDHPAAAAPEHAAHTHAARDHVAHDHAASADHHPPHDRDGCRTACCFAPVQLPEVAPAAVAVAPCRAVSYRDATRPVTGRAHAPEPGIPKRSA
ncbi:hypothetical protein GCM10007888_21500 [Methylobacterium oxalidis]|uniref:Uncharacterized protein n=1 Tax=Methylobacterium oxalidis TaxID=944322 RepID=A0ABQ6DIH4_9HYPH|nr:hypothetical protein GCM10007888_21500 [Methylobacterium oxalidis]